MTTPAEMFGEPEVVDLTLVLSEVSPAVGGNWVAAIEMLVEDPSEMRTIEMLAEELMDAPDGLFRVPVRIDPLTRDEEDEEELAHEWGIGNGMHRIAATVLCGFEKIRVMSTPDYTDPIRPENARELEVKVRMDLSKSVLPPELEPVDDYDDDLDPLLTACFWLRSLRLGDGNWVEALSMGACDGTVELVYGCSTEAVPDVLAAIQERCEEFNIATTFVSAGLRPVDYWDGFDDRTGPWADRGEPELEPVEVPTPALP